MESSPQQKPKDLDEALVLAASFSQHPFKAANVFSSQ
jgi:hypothetical protein